MMVKCLTAAALLAGLASAAQAGPATSLAAPGATVSDYWMPVAGGCGRGWHYTRAHGCMPPRINRQHTYKPSYRMWHHLKKPY